MPSMTVTTNGVAATQKYDDYAFAQQLQSHLADLSAISASVLVGRSMIPSPAAQASMVIVNQANLTNVALTIAAQPDVPRNVVVTVVDTTESLTTGKVTIVGVNAQGVDVTEELTYTRTGTTVTLTGNVAFATITSITTSTFATLGGSGDETIKVEGGYKFGLAFRGTLVGVHKECLDGDNETIGTVNTTYGTLVPSHTPDGTHNFDVWFTYTPAINADVTLIINKVNALLAKLETAKVLASA